MSVLPKSSKDFFDKLLSFLSINDINNYEFSTLENVEKETIITKNVRGSVRLRIRKFVALKDVEAKKKRLLKNSRLLNTKI